MTIPVGTAASTSTAAAATSAAAVFGDRLDLAERFAGWLTGAGITRGLLGPREADQIWERHLLNGVGIGSLIGAGSVVLDLGSGAGLPGIPLLLARPDLRMVLVEPKARRVEFLAEVCADLELSARVLRARATPDGVMLVPEGTIGDDVRPADVVTARAVAPIADLARWAAPLLRAGGRLLAVKGASAADELQRGRSVLEGLGYAEATVLSVGAMADSSRPPGPSGLSGSTGMDSPGTATVIAMTWMGGVSRET